jgi:hypothetical protein
MQQEWSKREARNTPVKFSSSSVSIGPKFEDDEKKKAETGSPSLPESFSKGGLAWRRIK